MAVIGVVLCIVCSGFGQPSGIFLRYLLGVIDFIAAPAVSEGEHAADQIAWETLVSR
jgi:hypothetical protein